MIVITKKKIIIVSIVFAVTIVICLCAFLVIKHYNKMSQIDLKNTIPYGYGKEAKVIIIAGQSNAAGWSHNDYLEKNVSKEQYKKYKNGFDNIYINYFGGLDNKSDSFVKCKVCQGESDKTFGPELGIAEKLNELYPDETFFIIKWAWGGTNLYEEWRSPGEEGNLGGPLYQSFVEYVRNSLEFLELKNYNIKIESMCWMQGESDSLNKQTALDYELNLSNFISDIRREFEGYSSNDGIAFIDAYIADSVYWTYYQDINHAKQKVADSSPINVVIDTISYGLTVDKEPKNNPDLAHYDSLSEIKLGHLFAEESVKFFDD